MHMHMVTHTCKSRHGCVGKWRVHVRRLQCLPASEVVFLVGDGCITRPQPSTCMCRRSTRVLSGGKHSKQRQKTASEKPCSDMCVWVCVCVLDCNVAAGKPGAVLFSITAGPESQGAAPLLKVLSAWADVSGSSAAITSDKGEVLGLIHISSTGERHDGVFFCRRWRAVVGIIDMAELF